MLSFMCPWRTVLVWYCCIMFSFLVYMMQRPEFPCNLMWVLYPQKNWLLYICITLAYYITHTPVLPQWSASLWYLYSYSLSNDSLQSLAGQTYAVTVRFACKDSQFAVVMTILGIHIGLVGKFFEKDFVFSLGITSWQGGIVNALI